MTTVLTPQRCAEIHRACFSTPRPWSAAEFSDFLSSSNCFINAHDSGFALGRLAGPEAELLTIAVLPEAQGQGVGRQLLVTFLEQAKDAGAEDVFLEVADTNTSAIHLYKTTGFKQSGMRKDYYAGPTGPRISAILFRKTFNA